MDDKLFDELIEGVESMIAFEKGKAPAGVKVTTFTPIDVKEIRQRMKLSQDKFAVVMNVSPGTVRNWEQGRRHVPGPAVRLMRIAEKHPEIIQEELTANH